MEITPCFIWQDLPDNDVIRVDDTYYMVSTSMHSMPGCPIMCSRDLMSWELVSYVFLTLADDDAHTLADGIGIYGKGSWAASLRFLDGYFYCLFNSNELHRAFLFRTDDILKTGWECFPLDSYCHDPSLLKDADGSLKIIYGGGDIRLASLSKAFKITDDRPLFETPRDGIMLRCEGCHAYLISGVYYLLFIEWPHTGNGRRREVCYRSEKLLGPYERRIILDEDFGVPGAGVAQGAIFELTDGSWAACMFQDHGAVGRIPYILPLRWEDGWPVVRTDIKPVPAPLPYAAHELHTGSTVLDSFAALASASDSFSVLSLAQWNHNPDESLCSVNEYGDLVLTSCGPSPKGVITARNTLTWRTYGPKCTFTVRLEHSGLKANSSAGIVALEGVFGTIGIRVDADGKRTLVSCRNDGSYGELVCAEVPITGSVITLRIDFDFTAGRDLAVHSYSMDGKAFTALCEPLKLCYTLDLFMGCRMGIYCYGDKESRITARVMGSRDVSQTAARIMESRDKS